MPTVNTKLDHKPPQQSLQRATRSVLMGVAATLAMAPLIPASPYIPLLALPAWGYAYFFLRRRQREITNLHAELGKKRGFTFTHMNVPRKLTPHGVPVPPKALWNAEWVPYDVVKVDEAYESGNATVWRKILRAPPPWLKILDQQRAWLQEFTPQRWESVARWWETWFLRPLLYRRHGSSAVGDAEADAAARDLEVELRCGVAIAGQPALWTRRIGFGDETDAFQALGVALRELADEGRALDEEVPAFPRFPQPEYDYLFIGRGFMWDAEHTQKIEDLKLRNLSDVTTNPQEQGDPRIYGVGSQQATDLFMEERQFNQMAGIFGSTGVGKTRYAEVLLVQVVRNGMPLLVIDPKGDQALTNRLAEECRRCGRGHQFRYFCLAAPTNQRTWRYLARYNPCYTYTDPAELAARIASVLPATKDPFWTNVAKAMVENCLTLCHWSNWYLRFISRRPDGTLPPKESLEVPRLLLAMQWARHHLDASPQRAAEAVDRIREQMHDPTWKPTAVDERDVVDLMNTKSLAGVPIYSPIEWIPTVRHVNEYEIDNTVAFLGWMLKIFYFHIFFASSRTASPTYPRIASNQEILSKSSKDHDPSATSMWSAYQNTRFHPLEVRYEAHAVLSHDQQRWQQFYDYFLPPHQDEEMARTENYELSRMFKSLRAVLESQYSDAGKERQKFLEYATTLQSAIKPFLGERSRIMCAIDSDIIWEAMIKERQVVYCALASMIDDNGATSCAKMIIQDIASYFGRRYQYEGGKADPVYIFADEVSSFINEPFIHLLNKCRGVGLRAIIAGQTRSDLAKQLGKEGAQQAMGNLNTVIQLRSPLDEDAKEFAGRAGEAKIVQEGRSVTISPSVGITGSSFIKGYQPAEGRNFQQQSVKRIPPEAVLALPLGQAFVHAKGQVFLLAQGLFDDPATNIYEEIGMHQGTMLEAIRPVPAHGVATTASRSATRARARPAGSPVSAPPAPLTASPPARGSSPAGPTFRVQTDLAGMADVPEPDERSGSNAGPRSLGGAAGTTDGTTSFTIRDAVLDDDDADAKPTAGQFI